MWLGPESHIGLSLLRDRPFDLETNPTHFPPIPRLRRARVLGPMLVGR